MNIQELKSNTTWQEASNTINNNNNKISLAIATLENATLKNRGYFTSVEKLNEAIPNPSVGSKAYVGTSEPYAIYIVENGVWVDSGYTGGDEIVANITTDRIEDGAVTSEKIATSAFDDTLSVSGKIAPANVVGEKLTELDKKVDALALGTFYGYFPDSISLPTDIPTPGYAYVGLDNPYKIWNFNGEFWSDSGTSIDMNDADEEDITRNIDGKLQFKDKEYGDGMGYVILRKNKTFIEQVTKENTIYEIRYDFDLNGQEIIIPQGCILDFKGGKLSNGSINLCNCLLEGNISFDRSINIKGTCLNNFYNIKNFGAKGDGITDDAPSIRNVCNIINKRGGGTLYIPAGTYFIDSYIEYIEGNPFSRSAFQILGNFEVVGEGESSKFLININKYQEPYNGYIMPGMLFSNMTENAFVKIEGNIKMTNFSVDYTLPTIDFPYTLGYVIAICRHQREFYKEYWNCNISLSNISVYNAVGGITVKIMGPKNLYINGNRHIKNGYDLDKLCTDYSCYYTNVENFYASNCYLDITFTAFETHNKHDHIYNNVIERCATAYIPVGEMFNEDGDVRVSILKFHDNTIKCNKVVSPYYYSDTQIYSLELYNNDIILDSEIGYFKSRYSLYIMPSTDSASGDSNWRPIKNVYIHNERIRQVDKTTKLSIYDRILRNTAIENMVIESCEFIDLAQMPVLIADNHGKCHMRRFVFNDNKLYNCGRLVDYTLGIESLHRSIIFFSIESSYDGRELSIEILNNYFKDYDTRSVLFHRVKKAVIKCNNKIKIKNNLIKVKEPIYIPGVSASTDELQTFDIEANFYDSEVSEVINYINQHCCGSFYGVMDGNSKISVYFEEGVHYDVSFFKTFGDNYRYSIVGYDYTIKRSIGYTPLGTLIKDLARSGYDYVCIKAGTSPIFIRNIATYIDSSKTEVESELQGLTAYDAVKGVPIWFDKNQKWVEYDGESVGIVRAGHSSQRPTNVKYGFHYYDIDFQEILTWNSTWKDHNGVTVDGITMRRGTTEQRNSLSLGPINAGFEFYDTTLGMYVFWDGGSWKNKQGIPIAGVTAIRGETSVRNSMNLSNNNNGFLYYDTTINKPVWWTGSKWVDAIGADV